MPPQRRPGAGSAKRFCSTKCRNAQVNLASGLAAYRLPNGSVGAIGEMAAVIDLMKQGFDVFRAISPCAACDLLAYHGSGMPLRIEVRTGYLHPKNGKRYFTKDKRDEGRFDHYAVVVWTDGVPHVTYEPPLPRLSDGG